MLRKSYIIIFIFLVALNICGQSLPRFADKTNVFKRNVPTFSTLPGIITDINGDLIDDIVALDKGYILRPAFGVVSNVPFLPGDTVTARFVVPEFSMVCNDFDFNGYPDIASFGSSGLGNIYYQKANGWSRNNIQVPFVAQTANVVDVNKDNIPELFICNDEGPNLLLKMSGNVLKEENSWFNFATIPTSDMSGNYGSDWADVNGDGIMDLAIAKCKAGVNDPRDPRRVNRLFVSDANGRFTDRAAAYGFDSGNQSWAVSFCDMDNDGDQDVFVVNHYAPNQIYENINGAYFRELDFPSRPENAIDFQVVWRDFDNDGYADLLLSGTQGVDIYRNNGSNRFVLSNQNSGIMPGVSVVCGDINDDGFIDIHAHNVKLLNSPGSTSDRMYVNEGNSNNFIKFSINGGSTNSLGIGTMVKVYTREKVQTRVVRSGESYGVSHSTQLHFGTGNSSKVDSVQVIWPAGQIQWFYNLECRKTYLLEQEKCLTEQMTLFPEEVLLDPGSSVRLEAPQGMISYKWNREEGSEIKEINVPGQFFVEMTDNNGCRHISKPVRILSSCLETDADLLGDRYVYLCNNERTTITSIPAKSYEWSDGTSARFIEIFQNGIWTLKATDVCGNTINDTIEVISAESLTENLNDKETIAGESVLLSAGGYLYEWYSDTLQQPVSVDSLFLTGSISRDTTFYYRKTQGLQSAKLSVGLYSFPDGAQYGSNNVSGSMPLEIQRPLTVHELKVMTDKPGLRKLLLRNSSGTLVYEKEFYLQFGANTLSVDWTLEKGNYVLRTDTFVNQNQLGHVSPRLVRNFENGLPYPFEINDVIKIPTSSGGLSYYYYFYDIKISHTLKNCFGQMEDVFIKIKTSDVNEAEVSDLVKIFPNPSEQQVNIILNEVSGDGKINIIDIFGRPVFVSPLVEHATISTVSWPAGMYHILIEYQGRNISQKIIKL